MKIKPILFSMLCALIAMPTACGVNTPSSESSNNSESILATENGISDIRINLKYGDLVIQSNRSCKSDIKSDETMISVSGSEYIPDISVHIEDDTLIVAEDENIPRTIKEPYFLYLYLPDDPYIHSLSVNSNNSNVSLSDGLTLDTLSVFLNVGGEIDIENAAISNLDLYTLSDPINISLKGDPGTYDYELRTEAGNEILLNGAAYDNTNPDSIQPDEENNVFLHNNNANGIKATTQGALTVQVK